MPRTAPANPLFLRDEAIDAQFELWLLAASGMQQAYAALLDEAQIDGIDFVILFLVSRHQNQTMAGLVQLTGRPKQIISRRLQLLEMRTLINRSPDQNDRRRRILSLGSQGEALVGHVLQQARLHLRRAFSAAGSEAVEGFKSVLSQLVEPKNARELGIAILRQP